MKEYIIECKFYGLRRLKSYCLEFLTTECEDGKECRKCCQQKEEILASKKKDMPVAKENKSPKLCKQCGENPAILRSNGKYLNGLCASCFGNKLRVSKQNRKNAPSPQGAASSAPTEGEPVVARHASRTQAKSLLMVDFSDYPELLASVQEDAKKQFRPPEMHILAVLSGVTKCA